MSEEKIAKINFFDAFCQLYEQKPIEKISVSELCKKAGYNRTTFYKNFLDIYDLLEQLENYLIQYLVEQTGERMITNSTIQMVAEIYLSKASYFSLLLTKDMNFVPKVKDTLRPYMTQIFEAHDKKYNEFAIDMAMSSILSTYTYWYQNQNVSSAEIAEFIVDSLENGIIKPKTTPFINK